MLTKWVHEEVFEAEFAPMSARLLDGDRAVVTIHMKSGYLKVGEDGLDKKCDKTVFEDIDD